MIGPVLWPMPPSLRIFDDQVTAFLERRCGKAITVALSPRRQAIDEAEMENALQSSIDKLDLWQARLPKGDDLKGAGAEGRVLWHVWLDLEADRTAPLQKKPGEKGRGDLENAFGVVHQGHDPMGYG